MHKKFNSWDSLSRRHCSTGCPIELTTIPIKQWRSLIKITPPPKKLWYFKRALKREKLHSRGKNVRIWLFAQRERPFFYSNLGPARRGAFLKKEGEGGREAGLEWEFKSLRMLLAMQEVCLWADNFGEYVRSISAHLCFKSLPTFLSVRGGPHGEWGRGEDFLWKERVLGFQHHVWTRQKDFGLY